MNERQQQLFKAITSQYIKTAIPVSSKMIVETGNFDLSPATIRNEMMDLESEGYIFQPHTSAGRMPTEKGYRFYVDQFVSPNQLSKKQQETLERATHATNADPFTLKTLAKAVADLADNAVFVAFSSHDFFYTGLSNLFVQPEFVEHELITHLSKVIDHLDQVIEKLYDRTDFEFDIAIGSQNPFGRDCSSVLGTYELHDQRGFFGILGPTRMDYQISLNLIKFSRELINHIQ